MKPCEIYYVRFEGSYAWKWRHRQLDGSVIESEEKYPLYYECVSAALRRGYQPDIECLAPGDGRRPSAH